MAIIVLHTEDTESLNVSPVTYHVSPITYHLSPPTPPLYTVGWVTKTKPPRKHKQIRTQTTVFKKKMFLSFVILAICPLISSLQLFWCRLLAEGDDIQPMDIAINRLNWPRDRFNEKECV